MCDFSDRSGYIQEMREADAYEAKAARIIEEIEQAKKTINNWVQNIDWKTADEVIKALSVIWVFDSPEANDEILQESIDELEEKIMETKNSCELQAVVEWLKAQMSRKKRMELRR
jgi:serine protease inhibitor